MPDTDMGEGPRPEDDMEVLERMSRANPVAPDDVDALSTSARARAAYERITDMSTTPSDTRARTLSRRFAPALVGTAAVLALVLAVAFGVGGGDPAPVATDGPGPVAGGDPAADSGQDPSVVPGGGMALCVDLYSLDTLVHRDVAFDGTVSAIDGDRITFDVNEWFTGGENDEVTLGGAESLTAISPDNDVQAQVGDRLLVAGDGGFAWICGFTQPYDEEVAADWRAVFAG